MVPLCHVMLSLGEGAVLGLYELIDIYYISCKDGEKKKKEKEKF